MGWVGWGVDRVVSEGEHPINVSPRDRTLMQRTAYLEDRLAQIWDQVWWLSIPWWRRALYAIFGYRAPIQHFYRTRGWWQEFLANELKWPRSPGT